MLSLPTLRHDGSMRPGSWSIRAIARHVLVICLALAPLFATGSPAAAETGYDLWLRYKALPAAQRRVVAQQVRQVVVTGTSPTLDIVRRELDRALAGMLQAPPPYAPAVTQDGALVIGTADALALPAATRAKVGQLGREGYLIGGMTRNGHRTTVITGNTDVAVLYGVFAWLERAQAGTPLTNPSIASAPKLAIRMLDHWDNIDGTVGRGYAGASIWDWWTLPDWRKQRYRDYARANASIGINGTALNNVNASADFLTHPYLVKAAALADVFRPYGIKVYLSPRFSAPIEIGGLKSADPLDPKVAAWWQAKAAEIHALIPDFGGFVVKANSEGQPGPQDYGRSHADGANMLAAALRPYGGTVIWRAFVYSNAEDKDRTKAAYAEFKPLDGTFADNVLLQVKNGPVDFQPREPFSPLFGAMPKTPLMLEVQVTKEYLGFATHLVYLGALFHEALSADTYADGPGTTVADVLERQARPSGIAGVANVGTDLDWTGGVFNQANWFALGRLAWDPHADPRAIAAEWAALTFTSDPRFLRPVVDMMMASRETVVDYMTPLGLAHQMVTGHHYGPAPWLDRSVYYNRADAKGIGFDRTAEGSDALAQYALGARARFANPDVDDERYLLWFHHVDWDRRLPTGQTVWETLVERYDRGVAGVAAMRATWAKLTPYVDRARFDQVASFLDVQQREAQWWRDASLAYYQDLTHRSLPAGHAAPPHPLAYYKSLKAARVPGQD